MKYLVIPAFTVMLASCAGTMPELRQADVPASFEQKAPGNAAIWPDREWWRGFSSPELDALVAEAHAENLDLAAAEARVRQADARVRQAGANLLPNISGGLSGNETESRPAGGPDSSSRSFGASISASYELDFWSRNLNTLSGTQASRDATRADRETVRLTTIASTANTYFQLLSLRERLAIARLNLENARAVLQITEARVENGVATPLELARQRATIAGQESAIPQLEQQVLSTRAALAVLLGRAPEGFDVAARDFAGIAAPQVAPGLTSELLVRRPDIVAAEANLRASHANLAVARAAFLPIVQITGSNRLGAAALSSLFNGPDMAISFGATLAQTIFDGGAIYARSDEAAARREEVLANYRGTVLAAFADVETALGNITNLSEQDRLQQEQLRQLERAFSIADTRYREGVDDYLSLLDAQRSLYSARDQSAQLKLTRLQALVALYRALGGGWRDPGAPDPARTQDLQ